MSPPPAPTTVVCLTAAGRGAVASLRISGPDAMQLMVQGFHPAGDRALQDHAVGCIVFGRWQDPANGEEIVVCRRDDRTWDLHCHGGPAAQGAITQWLAERGCRQIDWRAWLRDSCADPIAGDAKIALAHALTERAAAILNDQANGALSRELDAIEQSLQSSTPESHATALARVDELLRWSGFGIHLTTAWRVVLAGLPNVGKSSLINALLGYRRAIVDPTPGTTRDIVTGATALEGWPVELSDTAGLRTSVDPLESAGIRLTRGRATHADLVLWVSDASAAPSTWQAELADLSAPVLLVRNKCDLLAEPLADSLPEGMISTSALTGAGIEPLQQAIVARLVPAPPEPGQAIPFRPVHQQLLHSVRDLLLAARDDAALALLSHRAAWAPDAGS